MFVVRSASAGPGCGPDERSFLRPPENAAHGRREQAEHQRESCPARCLSERICRRLRQLRHLPLGLLPSLLDLLRGLLEALFQTVDDLFGLLRREVEPGLQNIEQLLPVLSSEDGVRSSKETLKEPLDVAARRTGAPRAIASGMMNPLRREFPLACERKPGKTSSGLQSASVFGVEPLRTGVRMAVCAPARRVVFEVAGSA